MAGRSRTRLTLIALVLTVLVTRTLLFAVLVRPAAIVPVSVGPKSVTKLKPVLKLLAVRTMSPVRTAQPRLPSLVPTLIVVLPLARTLAVLAPSTTRIFSPLVRVPSPLIRQSLIVSLLLGLRRHPRAALFAVVIPGSGVLTVLS